MSDPARARFFTMQLFRLGGVALVITGLLVLRDRISLPHLVGWMMVVPGLAAAFLVPQLLARKWRSGPK